MHGTVEAQNRIPHGLIIHIRLPLARLSVAPRFA